MISRRRLAIVIFVLFILVAATILWGYLELRQPPAAANPNAAAPAAPEYPVQVIPLEGPAAGANAEFSGLAWYNDTLILLPQYPQHMTSQGDGVLFAIPRETLLDAINDQAPVEPQQIPVVANGLYDKVPGFEGFEAIGFIGDRVYLTIEAHQGLFKMMGYLVEGEIAPDLSAVRLDPDTLVENKPQIQNENKSDEALLVIGDQMLTFFEVNGQKLNPAPHATNFDNQLHLLGALPMPRLEYRLTDASALDAQNRFWVINYYYPGDSNLKPKNDPLADQYGKGATHARSQNVERLVELQYSPQGITLVDTPPLQLQLLDTGDGRDWEGLARLEGLGFLLVTDKFPKTILGFVAYP